MKKIYPLFFLSLLSFVGIISTNATVRTVTCQNTPSHFLPVTVNAMVGDTIHWTWVAGTHVVGPIDNTYIPNGAAMFNAPIDAGHHSFEYKVTVAGNYQYECHPASPHGETAYIIVTPATGVSAVEFYRVSNAYPNPFTDKLIIETYQADLVFIYNLMGEKIKSVSLKNSQTKVQVDVAEFNSGIYFYSIIKEGVIVETRKVVKE